MNLLPSSVKETDVEVVLGYLKNEKTWTIVTAKEVWSVHNGGSYKIILDDICKTTKILNQDAAFKRKDRNYLKREAEILLLGAHQVPVWFPSGEAFGEMHGILRRFPLNPNLIALED